MPTTGSRQPAHPPGRAVLLRLDGVVHTSDLPVQSFARHTTEGLDPAQTQYIIGAMRGFLEGRTELIPAGIDLDDAEDGYQAVEIVARAMGLDDSRIAAARRASRADLAASAWAIDQPDGLRALLTELDGRALIGVLTEPDDAAAAAVIDAVEIGGFVDHVIDQPTGAAVVKMLERIGAAAQPDRLLVIGTNWSGELAAADGAGCMTALIDRFTRGRGTPSWRVDQLADVVGHVRTWLQAPATVPKGR